MDIKEMNAELAKIASMTISIDTLETRNSDSLDFHNVAVWDLRDALERAYLAGILSTAPGPMNEVLPTLNKEWGYWGTICSSRVGHENAFTAWNVASNIIRREVGASADTIRSFLDSAMGRHFADSVACNYEGDVLSAVEVAVGTWMKWNIGKIESAELGIPAELPYLVGHVLNLEEKS